MVARAKPSQLFSRSTYETPADFEYVSYIESAPFLLLTVEAAISPTGLSSAYYLLVYDITEEDMAETLQANQSPGRALLSWGPIIPGGTLVRDFPEPFRFCARCGVIVVRGTCSACEKPGWIDVYARPFDRGCVILLSTTPRLPSIPQIPNAGGPESAMSITARRQAL